MRTGCWNSCQEQMRRGLLFLFSPPSLLFLCLSSSGWNVDWRRPSRWLLDFCEPPPVKRLEKTKEKRGGWERRKQSFERCGGGGSFGCNDLLHVRENRIHVVKHAASERFAVLRWPWKRSRNFSGFKRWNAVQSYQCMEVVPDHLKKKKWTPQSESFELGKHTFTTWALKLIFNNLRRTVHHSKRTNCL